MQRGPLIDFTIEGPDGPAFLLPRRDIAVRQASFLQSLASEVGPTPDERMTEVLEVLVGFPVPPGSDARTARAVADFVADGTNWQVTESIASAWLSLSARARRVLDGRAVEPPLSFPSAVHSPHLAIPDMLTRGIVSDVAEAATVLSDYVELLEQHARSSSALAPNSHDDFLNSLADYGSHYELMAAMTVPLRRPFLIKYTERREVTYSRWRSRAFQRVVVADAITNHVSLSVHDPSTRLVDVTAMDPIEGRAAYATVTAHKSPDTHTFYAYGDDRAYQVDYKFRLKTLRRLQFVPLLAAGVLFLLGTALWFERVQDLSALAVIVGPASLAASVLLVRDPSSIGSRVRLLASTALALALLYLLAIAAGLYISSRAPKLSVVGDLLTLIAHHI